MTDLQTETSELPTLAQAQSGFSRAQAFRSFGLSILINGVCPAILYSYLAPYFAKESPTPLLYASLFPLFGLFLGIIRKRMIDFIAVIALFEITINIAAIFVTPSIRWALVARSLNGYLTGTAFLASALIGKPIIYYIARQFATGGDPARTKGFDAVNALDGGRAFRFATIIWAIGIYLQSTLTAVLALIVSTSVYLVVAPTISTTVNIVLIIWSIRYTQGRLLARLARS